MAQDLSQTIQEGVAQTLTDLLGVDAKFLETTKADKRDIGSSQLLQVNAEFEFDKLSTILKFMIPASTASIVFNTMMGSTEYDISDSIDDDTTDAMGEFVSNVSGSLVTAFNAKEIEELGKAKFNIQHKEVLEGNSIENIDTMYRFVIELNDQETILFINFDEEFLPHIEEISKAETTPYPEEETPAEEVKDEEPTKESESEEIVEKQEDPQSVITDEKNDDKEDEEIEEELEDEETLKKNKKMKLLIIIISSLIAIILIAFLTLYFMSDDEETETTEQTTEQMKEGQVGEVKEEQKNEDEITITPNKTLKKIDFNIKDIDIARLNGRLATLTKFEILTKEELQEQKKEEAQRLERLKKEEELKEFAKLNKEEPIIIEKNTEPKKEETQAILTPKKQIEPLQQKPTVEEKPKQETTEIKVKKEIEKKPEIVMVKTQELPKQEPETIKPMETQEQLFVLTNSIKYTLFKSLVLQTNSKNARISMCNDTEGRTTILIGPFETIEQQNKMDQLIKGSKENIETSLENLTNEEFNQRCNF